jgi:hypothetical protein
MATYVELLQAAEDPGLRTRMRVACIVAAELIRTEAGTVTNHANRLIWAKAVFANPIAEADRMLWAVLAQNRTATLAQVTGASDTALQTAVNNAVDVFATGS